MVGARRTSDRWHRVRDRLLRDIYVVIALAFVALRLFSIAPWDQSVDAYAYWSTGAGDVYGGATGAMGSYLYSPAFAQTLTPVSWLPWPIFNALWTIMNVALLWWLVGRWALLSLLFLPIPFEIISGNIHLLLAAAVVVSFRYPAAWAFAALTKVTPFVGVLWAVGRRDARAIVQATVATLAIAALSFVLAPDLWRRWIDLLIADVGRPLVTLGWYLPVPLLPRLVAAAALALWGGWTDRRWTVPVAVTLALPVVWLNSLAILAALVPLAQAARPAAGPAGHHSPAAQFLRAGPGSERRSGVATSINSSASIGLSLLVEGGHLLRGRGHDAAVSPGIRSEISRPRAWYSADEHVDDWRLVRCGPLCATRFPSERHHRIPQVVDHPGESVRVTCAARAAAPSSLSPRRHRSPAA